MLICVDLCGFSDDLTHLQVKFQLKKVLCMGVAVGNVSMTPDELRQGVVSVLD